MSETKFNPALYEKCLEDEIDKNENCSKMSCPVDTELVDDKCYLKCKVNYEQQGEKCVEICGEKYTDNGLTCTGTGARREIGKAIGNIISGDSYGRGAGKPAKLVCPDGMKKFGMSCKYPKKAKLYKGTFVCDADKSKNGLLCYPKCKSGYKDVGPLCVKDSTTYKKDIYDNPGVIQIEVNRLKNKL
jgi:hypothetical protein